MRPRFNNRTLSKTLRNYKQGQLGRWSVALTLTASLLGTLSQPVAAASLRVSERVEKVTPPSESVSVDRVRDHRRLLVNPPAPLVKAKPGGLRMNKALATPEKGAEPMPLVEGGQELQVPAQYATIQEAIDAAASGDLIRVAPGTYFERLDFQGKGLYLTSTEGPELTILDAEELGAVVSVVSGEPEGTTLEGFTLRNGAGFVGGAVSISSSQLNLTRCIVEDNRSDYGGALGVEWGVLNVHDTRLAQNEAYLLGGALYSDYYSTVQLINTEVRDNEAWYDGGGLWASLSELTMSNNVVRNNTQGDSDSAAVEVYDGTRATLVNNLFVDNVSSGPADVFLNMGSVELRNNIFAGSESSAALYNMNGQTTVAYNLFGSYPLGSTLNGSDPIEMEENLSGDPALLAYSNDGDPNNDDFTLSPVSPAIDAGDPAEQYRDPNGSRNDMGNLGGPLGADTTDSDGDGMTDGWELRYGLDPNQDDSALDLDEDGLTNLEEYTLRLDPSSPDTDVDGISDLAELLAGQNPRDASDNRPIAYAGEDDSVELGERLILTASGDDPNGDVLTYVWSLTQKPAESQLSTQDLEVAADGTLKFEPDVRGTFTLSLMANDGRVNSLLDAVNVSALGVLKVPSQFASIQSAVDAAFEHERVQVAPGLYSERVIIRKPLKLESEGGSAVTTLSGLGTYGRVMTIEAAESHVTGFTLRDSSDWYGGALLVSGGAHVFTDMRLIRNDASYAGGMGIDWYSTVQCVSCIFEENTGDQGAALSLDSESTLELLDSRFQNNAGEQGAIYAYLSTLSLTRTALVDNDGTWAGALYAYGTELLMRHSLVQANTATESNGAGGLSLHVCEDVTLRNNTFAGNWSTVTGDVWMADAQVRFENNIVAGGASIALYGEGRNTFDASYNDVYGYRIRYGGSLLEMTGRNGNISAPASFVAYSRDHITANDDFHLQSKSPALNAGNPTASQNDVDGSRNDMGMYGGPDAAP